MDTRNCQTLKNGSSKWSVKIKDIGSDQIVQHILPLQDVTEKKKSKRNSTSSGKTQ